MRLDNVLAYGLLLFGGACGLLGWLVIEGVIWLFNNLY